MIDQLTKAAKLWAQYATAADTLEAQARLKPEAETMRKAMVYRRNANQLYAWAHKNNLVKGFRIAKKTKWRGMDISIENPAGSVREWYDSFEKRKGMTFMIFDYGYLRGTTGADNDKVDCYMGPDLDAPLVYVVRQLKGPDFRYYDEDKCMIGFESQEATKQAYLAHYDNPRFLGLMDSFPVDSFIQAVKQTKKAPSPVGGWGSLMVQRRVSDMTEVLSSAVRSLVSDTDMDVGKPGEDTSAWKEAQIIG